MLYKDYGKKFDTMANVSNVAGNPMSVVMDIQVQLPHKIDTLAIVSISLPESLYIIIFG